MGGVTAIVGKGDLIRKVNFPKYVIILSVLTSGLINLALTSIVIVIFMIAGHVPVTFHALLLIPLLLEMILIALTAAFFLSTAFVRYRDVSYIWEVIIQASFYATPILYALTRVPHRFSRIIILNPFAQVIQDSRYVLITHSTQTISTIYHNKWMWAVPIGATLILFVVSATYFKRRSSLFAEEV
jgi:ABC-2 type transport system permease protein